MQSINTIITEKYNKKEQSNGDYEEKVTYKIKIRRTHVKRLGHFSHINTWQTENNT